MISVCMATHNGGRYIKEQVDSILIQLSANDEIIVSDDGSSDDTLHILRSYQDKRIKIFKYHNIRKNLPPCEHATLNFENALKNAKGDYIFLSDQDDVWIDNKVSVILTYLQKYDYVVSDAYVTDKNLNVISETRFVKEEKIHKNKYMALILSTPYQGSCAAFRKEVLRKALPFPKGLQSHDRWIGNIAAFYFNYAIIPDKLVYYRRHENTVSSAFGGAKSVHLLKIISYKLKYIWGLISIIGKYRR